MEKVIKTIASTVGNVTEVLPFQCCIIIDGKKLNCYDTLTLNQRFSEHHHFTITITTDQIENVWLADIPDPQTLISKHTTIQLYKGFALGAESNDFSGIITKAYYTQKASHKTILTIEGYSKSIIMDQGSTYCIRQDQSLNDIVADISSRTSGRLTIEKNPAFLAIHRTVTQCNQSDFEHLRSLAMFFGEWFYYRKDRLTFGKPKKEEPLITLYFGDNLREQHFKHTLQPLAHQSVYSYNIDGNHLEQNNNWPKADGYNEYAINHIEKADRWLTGSAATHAAAIHAVYKSEIDRYKQAMQAKAATSTYQLEATTTEHSIYPGVRVKIADGMLSKLNINQNGNDASLGEFMVLAVNHTYDNVTKEYKNTIVAIPYTPNVFPYHTSKPIEPVTASDQLGYVMNGPNAAGEMLVCPHGTTSPKYYAKLRVAQPDINNEGNGGYYVLPTKGSLVVIRHLYNNPNFPYIDACMPHGKNTDGVENTQNSIRRISTPAGHEICFDDGEETPCIRIADAKGNSIEFNSKEGKLYITAQKGIVLQGDTINIIGKQMTIDCSEIMQVKGADQCTFQAQQLLNMESETLSLQADNTGIVGRKDLKTVGKKIDIGAKENLGLFGKEVQVHGQSSLQLKSPKINNAMKADGHEENFEKPEEDLQFIVEFSVDAGPSGTYKGEFGFDWATCDEQGELIAVQGNPVTELEYIYDSKTNQYVEIARAPTALQQLRAEYEFSKLYNQPYLTPYLSMLSTQDPIQIKMDIRYLNKNAKPDDELITFDKNDYYEITLNGQTNEGIQYKDLADQKSVPITIKCKKAGPKQQLVARDETGQIIGKINVLDNTKAYDLTLHIIPLVQESTTQETDAQKLLNDFATNKVQERLNKNALNQAFIQCSIQSDPKTYLTFKPEDWDKQGYFDKTKNEFKDKSDQNAVLDFALKTFLASIDNNPNIKDKEAEKKKYQKGLIIFLSDYAKQENGATSNTVGTARTIPVDSNQVIIYKGGNDANTLDHEIGHALGLEHTFIDVAKENKKIKDWKKYKTTLLSKKQKREDYVTKDLPAWIEKYKQQTGKEPSENLYAKDKKNAIKEIKEIDTKLAKLNETFAVYANNKYRFKKYGMNNIMDYGGNKNAYFKWQWNLMISDVVKYHGNNV